MCAVMLLKDIVYSDIIEGVCVLLFYLKELMCYGIIKGTFGLWYI